MRRLLRSRRWIWAIVAVAVIAGLVFGGIALASAAKPTSNPEALSAKPTPTPWPSPPPTPPNQNQPVSTMSPEEQTIWLEQAKEENEKNGGFEYSTSGPATMGSTIYVKGKIIKLPDDAYVKMWVSLIDCGGPPCPEPPAYLIARGDSLIWVEQNSGKIFNEEIATNEEGAFDFLKEALR